jgi:hypothetical protein
MTQKITSGSHAARRDRVIRFLVIAVVVLLAAVAYMMFLPR